VACQVSTNEEFANDSRQAAENAKKAPYSHAGK
jgi:hypothetical protein